ncbi:hypothetical protein CHS0354_009204 [Potamilus streckersoni]|uniref:Uncharacterized protein n=1 Tax=Potamilus streckersoni TaxID=2493646 RepID=A0AAE0SZF0_9BIVA|nr:hypothetical protein CHS0354_009204 [Potamilus streckersoni]
MGLAYNVPFTLLSFQDVVGQISELHLLWTEVQKEFIGHLKEYKHTYEMILEGDKDIDRAKQNLTVCEQKEGKIRKELRKSTRKSNPVDIRVLEAKLSQAERTKEIAQLEVADKIRENEAVKLIRLKEGLLKLSDAYVDLGKKSCIVFESQRDIALQLPDVHGKELEEVKYSGAAACRNIVQQVRVKLRKCRRSADVSIANSFSELPPPYSPGMKTSDSSHIFHSSQDEHNSSPQQQTPSQQQQRLTDDSDDDLVGAVGGTSI